MDGLIKRLSNQINYYMGQVDYYMGQVDELHDENEKLQMRVEQMINAHELKDLEHQGFARQLKQKNTALSFIKLKLVDFERHAEMIRRLADNELIKSEARRLKEDVSDTFKAIEQEEYLVECKECGGGGFSEAGTGYDSVCGNCGGNGRYPL